MKIIDYTLKLATFCSIAGIFSVCTPEDGPKPAISADLDEFFETVPKWEEFSPLVPSTNVAIGPSVPNDEPTEIESIKYNCSSTPYSLTETPDKITTLNPDVEVLYVGSLLQGDGYLNGIGSLAELPVRQRTPVTITLDLLTGDNTRSVENPNVSSVGQAIGALVNDAQNAGHKAGSNIFYKSETTYSITQAALKMGISASYMGASIKASLETNMSDEKRTITAYFVQQMFTASMILPQYPEDVFSNDFTQDMLDREIASGRMNPENPPVYISSVVYGRIMMFSFTSTSSEAKIRATLSAVYNGGEFGGELDTELRQVLNNAEISVVTVGGDAEHALGLIRENNLAAFFSSDSPLSTAKPISYTVRNLKDNSIARVSETTTYNLKECTPMGPTGAVFTMKLTSIEAVALPNIDPVIQLPPKTAEIYYSFYMQNMAGPLPAARMDLILNGYTQLGEGDRKPLLYYESGKILKSEIPRFDNLKLYWDGRNDSKIRVFGTLWDNDFATGIGDDEFSFDRTFAGTGSGLVLDGEQREFSITSQDGSGNRFKLYGEYRKTGDLYD